MTTCNLRLDLFDANLGAHPPTECHSGDTRQVWITAESKNGEPKNVVNLAKKEVHPMSIVVKHILPGPIWLVQNVSTQNKKPSTTKPSGVIFKNHMNHNMHHKKKNQPCDLQVQETCSTKDLGLCNPGRRVSREILVTVIF